MSRVVRTPNEFRDAFSEQMNMLESSCGAFDAGKHFEAKRIAASLRILLHVTKHQRPLLERFGLFDWRLLSTNIFRHLGPKSVSFNHSGILGFGFGEGTAGYAPIMDISIHDKPENWLSFMEWWEVDVIHLAHEGPGVSLTKKPLPAEREFTRRKFVTLMADTDGGAHVDGGIDKTYAELLRQPSTGIKFRNLVGAELEVAPTAHIASVRQIATELMFSMKHNNCEFRE